MRNSSPMILVGFLVLAGCVNSGARQGMTSGAYVLRDVASPEACLISDSICLESKFFIACDPYSSSVVETCLNWLGDLERLPEPRHIQIKLLTAVTYYRLSELPAIIRQEEQALKVAGFERYRQNSRDLFREIHEGDSSNTDAMRGLSYTTDDEEEKLQWSRRIVRTETPTGITCRILSNQLFRVYESGQGRERAAAEAAKCFVKSYHNTEPQPGKWNIAAEAISSFETAGQTLQKSRFLTEVRSDIAPEKTLRELESMSRLSPGEVEFSLKTLCLGSVRVMLGVEQCVDGLTVALRSLSKVAPGVAASYADAVMEGIIELMRPTGIIVTEEITSEEVYFKALVEQEVLAKKIESGKVYAAYSMLANADQEKRFDSQLKAVELEPENGDYRTRLGHLYYQRGEVELAKQQYAQAMELLPEFRRSSLQRILRSMKIELE